MYPFVFIFTIASIFFLVISRTIKYTEKSVVTKTHAVRYSFYTKHLALEQTFSESHAGMKSRLYVNCALFLPDFNQNWNGPTIYL